VDHASPVVSQDHEDEQDLERHRGHREEVDRDQAPEVVVEKRAPGLRRSRSLAHHVLRHRSLGDLNAQLLQFPVNPRRAPEGVGARHPPDQRSDLRGDGRAALTISPALPGPIPREPGAMPPDNGLGLDQGEGFSPAAPHSAQKDPEQPVGDSQAWTRRGALEDSELVTQREVLEHQGAAGPEHEEESVEREGEHAGHDESGRREVQC